MGSDELQMLLVENMLNFKGTGPKSYEVGVQVTVVTLLLFYMGVCPGTLGPSHLQYLNNGKVNRFFWLSFATYPLVIS